jgi:hypothetical protein
VKDRLGHRLVETSQEGPQIDGFYLNIEALQLTILRLG